MGFNLKKTRRFYSFLEVCSKDSCRTMICPSENICDLERRICQNGGTCIDFQRCACPDNSTGQFCEQNVCMKKNGCITNASGSSSSVTSQLYLVAFSLTTYTFS
ncbi:hypothetical protein XENOCAPTIV_014112 [Xenoophorus captivus]|uniref:EGF-like domain-containing protein n=1 Tax=Xenoophorus captivus TaxID=1517983 RepID=A0ABV0QT17_9TELE